MTREEIITTAFHVWGRHFYKSTSLTDIAKSLGVSKPALYRHFKNKKDLLNAMCQRFFDNYAGFTKPFYDKVVAAQDSESLLDYIRAIVEYYARNESYSIFSLIQIYGNRVGNMRQQLLDRGIDDIDMARFNKDPMVIQFINAALIFILAHFHKQRVKGERFETPVTGEEVKSVVDFTMENISYGLRFSKGQIESLDYEGIEKKAAALPVLSEKNYLLKAIASAVAESGPWNVSLSMIAQKSGLSKSSLYCHFENKQDMIVKLFVTEFERLIAIAEEGKRLSGKPEEQLYLIIIVIANYLRSMPDILFALDWLRTRKINFPLSAAKREPFAEKYFDLGMSRFCALFSDLIPQSAYYTLTPQLILFLIVNTLMYNKKRAELPKVDNSRFRALYEFITLGITHSGAALLDGGGGL